jgi:Raf kinase inhibitor-like YbhB/YbcL family protein
MRTQTEEIKVALGFDTFPEVHTCDGADTSPRISIGGISTPYLAIILDDPDAPGGTYTHWLIWNIHAGDTIPENVSKTATPGELPGAIQGTHSGQRIGYKGPCPPSGKPHHYHLKVYGLDGPLDLKSGASKKDLERALEGKVRQFGEAVAVYGR